MIRPTFSAALILMLPLTTACNPMGKSSSRIHDLLIRGVKGGEVTIDLTVKYSERFRSNLGVIMNDHGWEIEDFSPIKESIQSGTAMATGRRLPAYVVVARFKAINRAKGLKRVDFVQLMAIDDKEFDMWREVQSCTEEAKADAELAEWKTRVSFNPNS